MQQHPDAPNDNTAHDTHKATRQRQWRRVRWAVVLVGVGLPYAAQLGQAGWQTYMDSGWQGQLFMAALGAVLWLPLLALTWLYRYPLSMLPPALLGLGFALWGHASVDLAADAQAALALIFIPLWALVPAAVGALMGAGMDLRARRKARVDAFNS